MKLKIYTDQSFLPENGRYLELLYPFWGMLPEPIGSPDAGRFDELTEKGEDYLTLCGRIQDADAVLLPAAYEHYPDFTLPLRMAELAYTHHLKLIIFFNSDSEENIPIVNALIFRTSFSQSRRKPNEFALPGWSCDFLKKYYNGKLNIRHKSKIPTVGYCGYIDFHHPLDRCIYYLKRLIKKRESLQACQVLRGRAVRFLSRSLKIKPNLIIRNSFMGVINTENTRREYVENIINSDYCLVARGGGNFSYRLYEVLSCGRIPVFINTDSVLPFDSYINWEKYLVWVEESDLKYIVRRITDLHKKLTDDDFINLQKQIRTLYEEWISPLGFCKNLYRFVKASS